MKIRHDYPIYLNPTWEELEELAKSGWDTVRIAVDGQNLILGSGHGNTHHSLAHFYGVHKGITPRERTGSVCASLDSCLILYYRGKQAYFNNDDDGGTDRARLTALRNCLSEQHYQMLTDLIQLSELTK